MAHTTARRRVVRVRLDAGRDERADTLAVEEPLEIRLGDDPYTTTMRTPGHDLELALGFLLSEGVVDGPAEVAGAIHCPDAVDAAGNRTHNVVEVALAPHVPPPDPARHRHVTSACGVCGTATVEAVLGGRPLALTANPLRLEPKVVAALPEAMRAAQRGFDRTGGLHAAALFTPDGELVALREDVGRHNAVDKVVGWSMGRGLLPLAGHVLQVSGRASFELVQKAVRAGCPVLAAVSAPSSLAVELADESGLTLVGFSRGDRFTIYTHPHRIP